jgi:hypothetical protein
LKSIVHVWLGARGLERRGARMLPPPPSAPLVYLPVAGQNIEDRAAGGPAPFRVARTEALEDLPRTPAEPPLFLEDQRDDLGRRLVW